jgi:4Fe-4S ferredoxin
MAFATHINMGRCTGCGNCAVACPVDALELHTAVPATTDKIYQVQNGKSEMLAINGNLCAGCGVCIEACPYDVIRLIGHLETAAVR